MIASFSKENVHWWVLLLYTSVVTLFCYWFVRHLLNVGRKREVVVDFLLLLSFVTKLVVKC